MYWGLFPLLIYYIQSFNQEISSFRKVGKKLKPVQLHVRRLVTVVAATGFLMLHIFLDILLGPLAPFQVHFGILYTIFNG